MANDPARAPLLLHCEHGSDRTGYLIAMYRVVIEGWERERAIAEMTAEDNGFHDVYRSLIDYVRAADVARLRTEFDAAHERAYGYAAPEDAVELVNVRLAAIGVTPRPRRAPLPEGGPDPGAALKGMREVWFTEGWRKTGVFDRTKLLRGNVIAGPAIVEEPDASTLVHPGWEAAVDQHGHLLVRAAT